MVPMVKHGNARSLGVLLFSLISVVSTNSQADSPLEAVSETTFCSANHAYCAHSTASPNRLIVYERNAPDRILWSRDEFVVKGLISDDGKTVASIYPGLNLLPLDATLDFVLVRILRRKGEAEEVHLRSLYSSIAEVPHSVSHLNWGGWVGIEHGRLVLERADRSLWRSHRL